MAAQRKIALPKLTVQVVKAPEEEILLPNLHRHFDVENVLGAGSVAIVRRVRRKSDQQLFAAKCVTSKEEEVLGTFREEYDIMSRLKPHPSILQVVEYVVEPNGFSLILELCSGGTLQTLVHHRGVLQDPEACRMLVQLLEGVHYMHSKRIIHRDLKPSNLLLADNSCMQLRISDFNSARPVGDHDQGPMLSHRCTPMCAAPEMILGWMWNERVDIWTTGLCLFYMLKGRIPFNSSHPQVQTQFMQMSLPEISYDGISDDLKSLLALCLAVDMRERSPAFELLQHPAVRSLVQGESSESWKRSLSWTNPESSESGKLEGLESGRSGSKLRSSQGYNSEGVGLKSKAALLSQLVEKKHEAWSKGRREVVSL